jgi:(1->4)-alpha-D-glucan 1-alpha-D-glucosylmutase
MAPSHLELALLIELPNVVNPPRLNEELGGAEAYGRFCQALSCHGLGQVLDIVPNHMAITGADNPW